jgi:hypothetical protein
MKEAPVRSTAPLLTVASLATALLLTGCTSAEEPGAGPDPADSPLSEYMNAVYGGDLSPEEQEKKARADEKEREELVSACMTEEGFEYVPVESTMSFSSGGDEWLPDDREWVSEYGYGMVKSPGMDDPAPESDYVDPNQDYVMSLSESEQQAYYEALSGPPIPEEEMSEDGSYEYDWETAGCYGSAQHEIDGDSPAESEEHKPLFDALNTLYTEMQNAPEFAELNASWASCMTDAGYSGFSTQQDAQMSIQDKSNALWEGEMGPEGPDESVTDALGEEEIETALADLDCREQTDYRKTSADVQADLEQQFIDDHKTELEALKADAEQGN